MVCSKEMLNGKLLALHPYPTQLLDWVLSLVHDSIIYSQSVKRQVERVRRGGGVGHLGLPRIICAYIIYTTRGACPHEFVL